jgi:hypothetical protein
MPSLSSNRNNRLERTHEAGAGITAPAPDANQQFTAVRAFSRQSSSAPIAPRWERDREATNGKAPQ